MPCSLKQKPRLVIDKKDYYVKGYVYKIIRSKFYLNLKKKVPFKHYLKNLFWKYIVMSHEKNNLEEENFYRKKIKEYYRISNSQFFKQINMSNKYNY